MPALKNTQHEIFAQGLVEKKTGSQAYIDAGYQENSGNATRLRQNEEIIARVSELQARHLLRHDVTIDTLTDELEEVKNLALRKGQAGAAVSAVMGIAKLHGLLTDKVEHTRSSLADILDDIDGRTRGLSDAAAN